MSKLESIVVVGASLAGLRAVETLRAEGYEGRLTLVGAEPHAPYDRPPLSKEILRGDWQPDRIELRREGLGGLAVEPRFGRSARALDSRARCVELDDGERLSFDGLVIATGAAARSLPGASDMPGAFVLRTLDDALRLRDSLAGSPRVVVVGAGFIGAEVAASCRARGLEVTLVEPLPTPLARSMGVEVGEVCAALHRDNGVDLRCGVGVAGFEGDGRVESVRLTDGTAIAADVAVVGIGVIPCTGWLESSGLEIDNGVVCDATCATSVEAVVAAGDVARWYNPLFDETMRVEHWDNAVSQGVAAARRLLHGAAAGPFAPVPTFWSDQYKTKIQFAGRIGPDDEMRIVSGSPDDYRFTALFRRARRLTGVLSFRRPRHVIKFSELIARRASWDEALEVEL